MWEKLGQRLHLAITLVSLSLVLTSPWIVIGRRLRPQAGLLDIWHVYAGLALLPLALLFGLKISRRGQWRLYFPYLAGHFHSAWQDCVALFRGRLPEAGGAGLFSVLEGLLLLLLLACCVTGGLWFLQQGGETALYWRSVHSVLAIAFVVLLVLHALFAAVQLVASMR